MLGNREHLGLRRERSVERLPRLRSVTRSVCNREQGTGNSYIMVGARHCRAPTGRSHLLKPLQRTNEEKFKSRNPLSGKLFSSLLPIAWRVAL